MKTVITQEGIHLTYIDQVPTTCYRQRDDGLDCFLYSICREASTVHRTGIQLQQQGPNGRVIGWCWWIPAVIQQPLAVIVDTKQGPNQVGSKILNLRIKNCGKLQVPTFWSNARSRSEIVFRFKSELYAKCYDTEIQSLTYMFKVLSVCSH